MQILFKNRILILFLKHLHFAMTALRHSFNIKPIYQSPFPEW